MLQVTVVTARCSRNGRLYGIRFERMAGSWVGTWAFAIGEERASREGYGRNEIRGAFSFSPEYRGCPHCEQIALVKCSCSKVSCWDGVTEEHCCPWCHRSGKLTGGVESLQAGGDR